MAIVFYLLGTLVFAAGGLWVFASLAAGVPSGADRFSLIAAAIVAAPGFSVMFAGLLLLGVSGALFRLDSISKSLKRLVALQRASAEPRQ